MKRAAIAMQVLVWSLATTGCRETCTNAEVRTGDKCVLDTRAMDARVDQVLDDDDATHDGGVSEAAATVEEGGSSLDSLDAEMNEDDAQAPDGDSDDDLDAHEPDLDSRADVCPVDVCAGGECMADDGSYTCRCHDGFIADGTQRCVAVVASIAAGSGYTCARKGNGVLCWGENSDGQLGNGKRASSSFPVGVVDLSAALEISAGSIHSCARTEDGSVLCWGSNRYGGLGNGATLDSAVPVTVTGLTGDVVQIAVGAGYACARRADGSVACWGNNEFRQLGAGSGVNASTPVSVRNVASAVEISTGGRHACARIADGQVVCWGDNSAGQLGNGNTSQANGALAVAGLTDAVEIAAGLLHTCARRASGEVVCWGDNDGGQLGNSTTMDSAVPVNVAALRDIVEISAGGMHTCARRATGNVVCWGRNGDTGQLGNGGTGISAAAVVVMGFADAAEISAGATHTCARRTDGTVVCWGYNVSGALGNGTTISSGTPVIVMGL